MTALEQFSAYVKEQNDKAEKDAKVLELLAGYVAAKPDAPEELKTIAAEKVNTITPVLPG